MSRPQVSLLIFSILVVVFLANSANAQSRDQDKPTPLTSSVISETLSPDTNGETYFYSFVAGPGDVSITLTVQGSSNVVQAGFALFDEKEIQLTKKFATTYLGNSSQAVDKVYLKRRQKVVMSVMLQNNTGLGNYRLHISGAAEFGQNRTTGGVSGDDPTTVRAPNRSDSLDCLPKHGTLIVKMKDGSKKMIDLSEAETITLVPEP